MAQVSFDVASSMQDNNSTQYSNNVEFFNLVNDGDEAIVRFMHDDVSSFNILTVHNVQVGGKYRKVNCIRQPQEPTDMCPLCASGNNISNRFFIHLLVYTQDANGNIICKPQVWERGFNYATRLKSLLDEYGPLSNELFKVKRKGARGSMDTTYDILYCNPKIYNNESYPINRDAFNNYSELGTIVMNKDAVAMNTFIATGSFPEVQQTQNNTSNVAPAYTPKPEVNNVAPTYNNAPNVAPVNVPPSNNTPNTTGTPPWMNPNTTTAPTGGPGPRYY